MAATSATAKPLKQLETLLGKITHDELLKFVQAGHRELGRRAQSYCDAIDEFDPPPRDLVNVREFLEACGESASTN